MATESNQAGVRRNGTDSTGTGRSFQRRERGPDEPLRRGPELTHAGVLEQLTSAKASAELLEDRPRAKCRIATIRTTNEFVITGADDLLGLMLHRTPRGFSGLPFAGLIAGPDRRLFAERVKGLLEGPEGSEWETRIIAPGALLGVPVAISLDRSRSGTLSWYLRDLTELRRAQALVMHLEQLAAPV